ncbi:MAG: hypothetical protein IT289_10020 [Oligoflexia bacterium]|nr:hypothetical protein [Oligoflexia bacterium]
MIKSYQRGLPRYEVPEALKTRFIARLTADKDYIGSIAELSVNAIKIALPNTEQLPKLTKVFFSNGAEALGTLTRSTGTVGVFQLSFKDNQQFGLYFELFALIAFPDLRPRGSFPTTAVLDTYVASGFFDKFGTEERAEILKSIPKVWSRLSGAQHNVCADFAVVDDEERILGTNSTILALKEEQNEIWCFQHTCMLKNTKHLHHTRTLYCWRAEYLAGRKGDIAVYAFFDSKSRWIDRIYIKFANISPIKNIVRTCTYQKIVFRTNGKVMPDQKRTIEFEGIRFGEFVRWFYSDEQVLIGFNPRYVNAADNLEQIFVRNASATSETVEAYAQEVMRKSGDSVKKLSIISEHSINFENSQNTLFDRYSLFPKSQLGLFIQSVNYAIAVTERKFLLGLGQHA